jgi:hypothetical protein
MKAMFSIKEARESAITLVEYTFEGFAKRIRKSSSHHFCVISLHVSGTFKWHDELVINHLRFTVIL